MSFRCESCDEAQPTGVAPRRIVTEVRILNEEPTEFSDPSRSEIAAEKNFCVTCAEPWEAEAKAQKERRLPPSLKGLQN